MGRFDKFFETVNRVANPQIEEGDALKNADNPRNWLSGNINKILPDDFQIPLQTVAEDKQYMQNLPETMAGAAMGSIGKVIPSARFGNIKQILDDVKPTGSVTVKPSAQNLVEEGIQSSMKNKTLNANEIMRKFKENFGEAAVKQKERFKSDGNLHAYDSWKQEMLDKIRRGEL